MKDKNGNDITIGTKIKDEQGIYVVRLGSFEREDDDEYIAYGNNGINKLLWPERALLFEVVQT